MSHGVNIQEQASASKPTVKVDAGLIVAVGTAPITAGDATEVNKAVLCNSLTEFEAKFGPLSDDFENWSLHEVAKAAFLVYNIAPVVFICVSDPANEDHLAEATDESHQLVDGEVALQVYGGPDEPMRGIVKSSVVVAGAVLDTDYTLAFDDDGFLVLTIIEGGTLAEDEVISVSFDYLDSSLVTADDIIGGVTAGQPTGLEVVKKVYPATRKVPGIIIAPGWSSTPEVQARMSTIAHSFSGGLRAHTFTDLSTDPGEIGDYTEAGAWKADNGFTSVDSTPWWPKLKNGDDVYHLSTALACVANQVDAANDGIPYASPSNKAVQGTAAVDDDGTEILLDKDEANILNDQGIGTLLNGFNGWRSWGNRTGGYPGETDPKDAFTAIRRMFNWIGNTIILTTDANVDAPINRRLVDLVQGTIQSYLNGLKARGALVDGTILFLEEDNSVADLSNGSITWDVTLTPPSPGEQLNFKVAYDAAGLAALFA